MKNFLYKGRFIFIPIAIVAFLSIASFAVMTLWNCIIPDIFHIGNITFGQAMGLFVLCKILFGFGRGNKGWGGRGAPWMRHRMEERFRNMTPEEKEKFKQKMRDRANCGPWGRHEGHFNRNWDDFEKEATKPVE